MMKQMGGGAGRITVWGSKARGRGSLYGWFNRRRPEWGRSGRAVLAQSVALCYSGSVGVEEFVRFVASGIIRSSLKQVLNYV